MSTPIQDGGPAFPVQMITRQADGQPMSAGKFFEGGNGLSLRDYLAASITLDESAEPTMELCEALAGPRPQGNWQTHPVEWVKWAAAWRAKIRYIEADAMLTTRKEPIE